MQSRQILLHNQQKLNQLLLHKNATKTSAIGKEIVQFQPRPMSHTSLKAVNIIVQSDPYYSYHWCLG